MSFFSSIGNAIKSVVSPVADVLSGGLGSVVSGGLSLLGGIQTNNANAAQAQANRDFQADQTGTAYQRAVTDLKAAGLNPMLAYTNGGAASGSGAQATMTNAIGSAVSTAMQARMNNAQVENLKAQNEQIKAQTLQAISQSDLNRASTVKAAADTLVSKASASKIANDSLLSAASIPAARNAASAESSWLSRNIYPHWDRAMKSVNQLPILNWFNSK